MFMPFFNTGFGFTGGFYAPPCCCCNPFGVSTFAFNPFFTNMAIFNPFMMTNLCSVNYANNYNFQTSYNCQTPDISLFMPSMDFSQYNMTPVQNLSMDSFYNNLVSTISKNMFNVPQLQTTQEVEQPKEEKSNTDENGKVQSGDKKPSASSVSSVKETPSVKTQKEVSYDAQKLETKWKNSSFAKQSKSKLKSLPSEFFQKVVDISKKINCDPDDLMAVMNFESAGTFSASVKNPHSSATGLIQFTESTASGNKDNAGLGTTCAKLAQMTETEQLDYVEKYFIKTSAKFNHEHLDLATLYALILAPANAKEDVLYSGNTEAYKKNKKNLDTNDDGKITKNEAARRVMSCLA